MRIWLLLLVFCLPVLAVDDSLSISINLDALEFEFLPCNINHPIIKLNVASLKKYNDSLMVIKHNDVKYTWRNKSVLFRGRTNLGCYKFLCVRWTFGYQFFY